MTTKIIMVKTYLAISRELYLGYNASMVRSTLSLKEKTHNKVIALETKFNPSEAAVAAVPDIFNIQKQVVYLIKKAPDS